MKKLLIFILCVLMILPLAACGSGEQDASSDAAPDSSNTAASDGQAVVVLKPVPDDPDAIRANQLETAKEYFEYRLEELSLDGSTVTIGNDNTLTLRLSSDFSGTDPETLAALPKLTFRNNDGEVLMGAGEIELAFASSQQNGDTVTMPVLQINFTEEGAKRFAELTEEYLGQSIALYLDDDLIFNPIVNAVITDGQIMVSGDIDIDEACRTAAFINAAALPFRFAVASVEP